MILPSVRIKEYYGYPAVLTKGADCWTLILWENTSSSRFVDPRSSMTITSGIIELRSQSRSGIFAVPYRARHRRKPFRLPDGAIVEMPTADERCEAPDLPSACFEVAAGGGPATIHHANLGLVAELLSFAGVYLLPSGDVAAVYGAEAVPIR
jgi:hypothetical protein